MGLHLSFTGEDGVLAFVVAQADLDGVEVLIQLMELQLPLGELVEGDAQQTVLVELPDVVKAWRGATGKQEHVFTLISSEKSPFLHTATICLTNIKLKAFLYKGVAAAARLVMLLQHQDSLPRLGQRGSGGQPADTAPDDDDIQVLGHFVGAETCQTNPECDVISTTETSKCVVSSGYVTVWRLRCFLSCHEHTVNLLDEKSVSVMSWWQ